MVRTDHCMSPLAYKLCMNLYIAQLPLHRTIDIVQKRTVLVSIRVGIILMTAMPLALGYLVIVVVIFAVNLVFALLKE